MFIKAPTDTLDYMWDWSEWLASTNGDTIASVAWTASSGITLETSPATSSTATTATAWIGGGTVATTYTLTCQITTVAGRVAQNTQDINVVDL
ncbi:hypothetical protein ACAG26_24275 [Mycobacterium sp. pUA109]|uniref:phage fiber-tail adaptor protein n=1 Tax=Mycobacterium sp. pUA109 TaxID=3238982 RepID=UPI00351B387C